MIRDRWVFRLVAVSCAAASAVASARACTSILVSRGAWRDGSVIVRYSAEPEVASVSAGHRMPVQTC